jgi:hypothetical protein
MSGHRQAALALHALAGDDRHAILSQLPEADQAALHGYLKELAALGFEGGGWQPSPASNELETASAAALFTVLEREPATLVAQVFRLQAWAWEPELLALYPPARREQIRAAASLRPAPARAAFLRQALAKRLAEQASPGVAPLKKWWRVWRR